MMANVALHQYNHSNIFKWNNRLCKKDKKLKFTYKKALQLKQNETNS